MPDSVSITGCRHDVLGHCLKAIGILRALAECAPEGHEDIEAEGWWDLDDGSFRLRSPKYPDEASLAEFFARHYRPTPVFSPWNTGGGLDEKREWILSLSRTPVARFLWKNRKLLKEHGFRPGKHRWKNGKLSFDLQGQMPTGALNAPAELSVEEGATLSGKKPKRRLVIQWTGEHQRTLANFVVENLDSLRQAGLSKAVAEKAQRGETLGDSLRISLKSMPPVSLPSSLRSRIRIKTSGEKAVLAVVQQRFAGSTGIQTNLEQGRKAFAELRDADSWEDRRDILETFRDALAEPGSSAMDAIFSLRITSGEANNPLFLERAKSGNSEIIRSFWSYFVDFRHAAEALTYASLFSKSPSVWDKIKSPGSPFFPDAVKTYNNGLGWVVETYPFNALDFLLAVEGALALRGAVTRTLAANSRRFAAFPFVFDSGEEMLDDEGKVKGTAASVWLPLWDRPTAFSELSSFITDAQARLPGKDARFSSEFARALHAQGVDAGFVGWQEFRLKMKASRVPWVCTGRYLGNTFSKRPALLNDALAPLDESGFLDQFEMLYEGGKVSSRSPHVLRADINEVIEEATANPTPDNVLEILVRLYEVFRRLALSQSLRENIGKTRERVAFFKPLPMDAWEGLLEGFDVVQNYEFEIARALASITGRARQRAGEFSEVQPMLGSMLPLKCGPNGWYVPTRTEDLSKQAVWTGADLWQDLANVMARRYLDSLDDDVPAIASPRPASLEALLAFLRGETDEQRIARWGEALSLVGWHFEKRSESSIKSPRGTEHQPPNGADGSLSAIPPVYAALRSLLEVECEWHRRDASQDSDDSSSSAKLARRRSQRPIFLVCQRSAASVELAFREALHWLSVWGVPNPYSNESRKEKERLAGRDVVRALGLRVDDQIARRLAAAVLVPLDRSDRWKIFQQVTLPQIVYA
jgi:CRISPR-associated protein Csx17